MTAKQTNRQTDRQTERQTDRQRERTDRQRDREREPAIAEPRVKAAKHLARIEQHTVPHSYETEHCSAEIQTTAFCWFGGKRRRC
jgi:hypothetical protein